MRAGETWGSATSDSNREDWLADFGAAVSRNRSSIRIAPSGPVRPKSKHDAFTTPFLPPRAIRPLISRSAAPKSPRNRALNSVAEYHVPQKSRRKWAPNSVAHYRTTRINPGQSLRRTPTWSPARRSPRAATCSASSPSSFLICLFAPCSIRSLATLVRPSRAAK